MIKRSLFRFIILALLQGSILVNQILLIKNSPNYLIYTKIGINSRYSITQENSSNDSTPPLISKPADVIYLVNTTGHNITWYLADKNPGNYSIQHNYQYIDTEYNKTWIENRSVSISIDNLSIGIHLFTIIVEDSWGNKIFDDVIVTVKEIANVPTFNFTNNYDNLADIAEIFVLSGFYLFIIISIILIVSGIIRYRKKQNITPNLPPEDPLDLELIEDEGFL